MNERKQHVVKYAHQLFVEKGYQATSIQDILDYSGISKGTFYNYFPSKSDLLKAVFTMTQNKLEQERNDLLIGQNMHDPEIFISQLELHFQSNQSNQLFSLYEEALITHDHELKQFMKEAQFQYIKWLSDRFLDIFGNDKQPYILDAAVLFTGMMQKTLHYSALAKKQAFQPKETIRYCIDRIRNIIHDISQSGTQLIEPDYMYEWLPESRMQKEDFHQALLNKTTALRMAIMKQSHEEADRERLFKLVQFIQEECLKEEKPRRFLIDSALLSLRQCPLLSEINELQELENLIPREDS